jgi:co-chaperonin GroES (HSP10)
MAKTARVLQFQPNKPIRRKINLKTPMGKINPHWVEVVHERDPKEVIQESLGAVSADLVQFSRILVAIYKPPMVTKSKGGIILTDSMAQEDADEYYWQGKVGLIVAMGSQAYVDDDSVKFHGTRNKVGDWVWFMPSNGQACEVNEVFCRVFDSERFINGTIPHPDFIW